MNWFCAPGVLILMVAIAVGGCGNVQFPPPGAPRDINRPPPTQQRAEAAPSGNVSRVQLKKNAFVGASAVTVGPGDTVYALSRRHRVPVPAIIRANGLQPPYLLRVGQRIELPRGQQHRVTQGDTLYSIAQSFDVGVYELARLNAVEPPYTIKLGEILVIPEQEKGEKPSPPADSKTVTETAPAPPPSPKPAPKPAPLPRKMERAKDAPTEGGNIAMIPPKKPPVPVPPPPRRTGGFIWPVRGPLMSSFGAKDGGLRNDGINIIADWGTPVRAAENGVVAYAGNEIRGFGNLLLIKHDGGYITAYAHNDRLMVTRGQRVNRGDQIGTVGQTGSVNRPQLHFEIRKGRRPRDPKKYLTGTG